MLQVNGSMSLQVRGDTSSQPDCDAVVATSHAYVASLSAVPVPHVSDGGQGGGAGGGSEGDGASDTCAGRCKGDGKRAGEHTQNQQSSSGM